MGILDTIVRSEYLAKNWAYETLGLNALHSELNNYYNTAERFVVKGLKTIDEAVQKLDDAAFNFWERKAQRMYDDEKNINAHGYSALALAAILGVGEIAATHNLIFTLNAGAPLLQIISPTIRPGEKKNRGKSNVERFWDWYDTSRLAETEKYVRPIVESPEKGLQKVIKGWNYLAATPFGKTAIKYARGYFGYPGTIANGMAGVGFIAYGSAHGEKWLVNYGLLLATGMVGGISMVSANYLFDARKKIREKIQSHTKKNNMEKNAENIDSVGPIFDEPKAPLIPNANAGSLSASLEQRISGD